MRNRGKKFLEKNAENLHKLDEFVAENKDRIKLLITSTEMVAYLVDAELVIIEHELVTKFNGVRIISDPYFPVSMINVVYKSPDFTLSVPCVCGIYGDEPHSHLR